MSALRSRQKGSFPLPLPPDQAFDLFTAEGERRWVDGWDPDILSECGAHEPGAVFLTDHGGERTIWTVIEADRSAGRLLYSRVSPGLRAGTVSVKLADEDGGTRVHVAYDITALGPEGETAVAAMDAAGFADMLGEWRQLIERSLTGQR
jgi:hypothetical protein